MARTNAGTRYTTRELDAELLRRQQFPPQAIAG